MSYCRFTSEQHGAAWVHKCVDCGGQFRVSSPVYVRICRLSAKEKPPPPPARTPCIHLGAELRSEPCQFCKKRTKFVTVQECAIWGTCSLRPYRAGQPEQDCTSCKQYEPMPAQPCHLPTIPQGFPAPPPDLTPLPAGRDSFNRDEWRRVPAEHKEYYRALKRFRDQGEMPKQPGITPSPHALEPDSTPFRSPSGKPLHLSHFGQGGSAFVVLGGPSLTTLDLRQLSRRGIWSIGVNNVSAMVKTSAWCGVDTPGKFADSIWCDPSVMKFVGNRQMGKEIRSRKPDGTFASMLGTNGRPLLVRDMPAVVAVERNADFQPEQWLSEVSVNWGMSKRSAKRSRDRYPQVLNSMLFVVKLVYSLGFRVVYLCGADFSMSVEQPYAFPQGKSPGAVSSNNSSYRKLNEMFAMLQPHFLASNFYIYNVNKTSGLTVFPHCPFELAIETAISRVPQSPDLSNWYEGYAGN